MNIRAALVVGANRYSRNNNSVHSAGLSVTMAPRAQTGDVGAHPAPLLLSGSGAAALNAPRRCVKIRSSAQSGDSPQWLITILFSPVQFLDWKPTMLRFAKNCTSTREQFLMLISTEATHKYQH